MGATANDFEAFFRKADLDGDGQISGAEAVAFFQGSGLPKNVLAQVWTYADQKKAGYLGREEFYNALKLVTVAQSQRNLTPDIVKSALYGPAASKIPAPKINIASTSRQSPISSLQSPSTSSPVSQGTTIRPEQSSQQYFSSSQNLLTLAAPSNLPVATHQPQPFVIQHRGIAPTPSPADMVGGRTIHPNPGQIRPSLPLNTQYVIGPTTAGLTPNVQSEMESEKVSTIQAPPNPPSSKDLASGGSKISSASANGFSSESLFGDAFSATPIKQNQITTARVSVGSSVPGTPAIVPGGSQPSLSSGLIASPQRTFSQQNVHVLAPETQNRQIAGQNLSPSPSYTVEAGGTSSSSQPPWPKMSSHDINKYVKVFLQVDSDRDGKITGEQARNLFLSWKLPREILKQIWDLSDHDNDSMLSLKEFCVAVYLMERYREGRAPPVTVPKSVSTDETLLSAVNHTSSFYGGASVKHTPVIRHTQAFSSARPSSVASAPRPPRPPVAHTFDERQTSQQKPKMPSVEKLLLNQLSEEEQNTLNSKLQEVSEADKQVGELEKEISESRQKIDFFRTKMQELIIYKSRCDSKLNEVSARVSSDRREADGLAKKYEEKCKQAGDVASRLTLEEATFRDIQEKKMEMYRAIVKMEGDPTDDVVKERVGRIQSGLEELMKSLNERCKLYGLRSNPTSLVELPFGWQPGLQEGAADLDEDWDKFDDEGFTFVKELTLDIPNVVATPKKKASVKTETTSTDESPKVQSPNAEKKLENGTPVIDMKDDAEKSMGHTSVNGLMNSPPVSPGIDTPEWKSRRNQVSPFRINDGDFSSVDTESQSEMGAGKGKSVSESWSSFDNIHRDGALASGFDQVSKEGGLDIKMERPDYDIGDFGLKSIRTMLPTEKLSLFADSAPSTPAYDIGKGSFPDSVPGTPAYGRNIFADSVPSTPLYNQGKNQFTFAESVPSTPGYNLGMSSYAFADSVPSTPAYNNSPRRFSDGKDGHSFDSFSRFDSFDIHDGGLFQSSNSSLARFDSMRSSVESEFGYGFSSQYDYSKDTGRQEQNRAFSRFDSFSSTDQDALEFDSFRDSDQSSAFPSRFDAFFTASDSERSRGFSSFDSFSAKDNGDSGASLARFDSVRSNRDADNGFGFSSFDDGDPFGSGGPFKSSVDSETPRKTHDNWGF